MAPQSIELDKTYRVKLARATEVAPEVWARPKDVVVLSGEVLEALKDNVESFEEV